MHLYDDAHRLHHRTIQQGLLNDNSLYKSQLAPNHKEPMYLKWHIPLKVRCFIWIYFENKILT